MSYLATQRLSYPATRKTDQEDNYHGTLVADPYRWLEEENNSETRQWIQDQSKLTFDYLDSLPSRNTIRDRIAELWNYPRLSSPTQKNGKYFFFKNDGLQNQPVFYCQRSLDATPEIVLDPNTFSDDGTVALTFCRLSQDARYVGYGIAATGSDWQTVHVRDIETGQEIDNNVEWVKFSFINWTHDNQGFFYSRYPAPEPDKQYSASNLYHTIYYHRLGTSQDQDILIHQDKENPKLNFYSEISDDGRYLFVSISGVAGPINKLGYIDLEDSLHPVFHNPLIVLTGDLEGSFHPINNDGNTFYIQTNFEAPHGRIIKVDTTNPSPEHWETILPEGKDTLSNAVLVRDQIFATYLHNAYNVVRVYNLSGEFKRELPTPPLSTVMGTASTRNTDEIFYIVTSYLFPTTIYRYDLATDVLEPFYQPEIEFAPEEYETKQLWFTSKDGTQVPMSVTHRKGIDLNGKNPTILYGYGGFNKALTPGFSVVQAVWIERGGIYVNVNLRGGGEFGDEWYRSGTQERKQNVFDDFIAAAEHLIDVGYTSPEYLAVKGGSNGGLLVGAIMTQRPDLIAVATPAVGVLDMLRYHQFTIGRAWAQDYGTSDDPDMFSVLYGYSPLHNLQEGVNYPATLVITGDHDDRVVPAHSFKFAARLQECQTNGKPALIRIETRAGHGAGKPLNLIIQQAADELSFIWENMPGKE